MKILVLSNLYPPDVIGGYELGCRQVVDGLGEKGHTVRVLTTAPRCPAPAEPHIHRTLHLTDIWSAYLARKNLPPVTRLVQARSHLVDAGNVHALLNELQDFQPDVVYVWMIVGIGGLGLMATLHHLRIPWVWHLMDDVPLILCKLAGHLVPTLANEFGRQLDGTYVSCSQQLVDEIEQGGISLGRDVVVLPNWVTRQARESNRSEYLRDGVLRIISAAGQIERRSDKGLDILVEAASQLRQRGHERFQVDLYGNVADSSIPDLIHQLDLSDHVHLRGRRTQAELLSIYDRHDVFAFPTRIREPFGFAALEAAARGCVPLMTQVCGIAEWLVHGVHCLKAPRTAGAFAEALETVLNGQVDLESIGRRAASVVNRDFTLDRILPRLERVLDSAARRPRQGAGTPQEAYHLALLAERLTHVLIQETLVA